MEKHGTKIKGVVIALLLLAMASVAIAFVTEFDDDVWLYGDNLKLYFYDTDSSTDYYITFRAPELTANFDYILPNTTPTYSGQQMRCGTTGSLSWGTIYNPSTYVGLNEDYPLAPLHIRTNPLSDDTIIETLRIDRETGGTAANGIGQQIAFYVEDVPGDVDKVGYISSWISSSSRGNLALGVDVDGGQNYHDIIRIGDASQDVDFYDFDSGYYTTFNFTGLTEDSTLTFDIGSSHKISLRADLYVEAGADSYVNQDLTTDAKPEFLHINRTGSVSAFEADGNDDWMPVNGTFSDTYWDTDSSDGLMPILYVEFSLDSNNDLMPL